MNNIFFRTLFKNVPSRWLLMKYLIIFNGLKSVVTKCTEPMALKNANEIIPYKIFQPFFTTKLTGESTGLGLSRAYDIVKAHGGEIKGESEEARGTILIIQLPAQRKQ